MKRILQLTMTMLLLLAATGTKADNYTGTVERFGEKMKYTISGGVVTSKSGPWLPLTDCIMSPNSKVWANIGVEVEPGETISLTVERLEGTSEWYRKCEIHIGDRKLVKEDKATITMRIPDTMQELHAKVVYLGKNSAFEYNIFYTVKKKVNTTAETYRGKTDVAMAFEDPSGYVNYTITGRNFRKYGSSDNELIADYYLGESVNITSEATTTASGEAYQTVVSYGNDRKEKLNGSVSTTYTIRNSDDHFFIGAMMDGTGPHDFQTSGGVTVHVNLIDRNAPPTEPARNIKWNDVAYDNKCLCCGSDYSHFKANGYGATQRCLKGTSSDDKPLEPGKVIYGNTRITTDELDVGIDYGDQHNAIIIEKGSIVEFTNEHGVQMWNVIKGGIRGINLHPIKGSGGSFLFYTPHIKAIPFGTVFVIQNNNNASRVYLLSGSMEVTSKKTSKKVTLKPGQASSVSTNGEQKVQQFDIKKAAKKFGISEADLQGTAAVGTIFTDKKVNYKIISTKTVEVTSEVRGIYSGKVKIPAKVKYNDVEYSVVGIGKKAFADQTKLTSIVIPTSIRGIAEDAFLNTGLTEVTIPGDKVSVVKNAFRNCLKLTTVTISGNEPACSPDAFIGCSAMKELRIRGISESNNGKKLNGTNAIIKVIK